MMAYDPVLDREMFRPRARSSGIEDFINYERPEVLARREQALAMMDMAKQKFDPANYQTLKEQDRPGVFRPVAVNIPAQQQTANTVMRMQQMAAQGVNPVGFEEGGLASIKEFIESGFGLENVVPGLKALRERNAERLRPAIYADRPELTQNAPGDEDLPTPADLNMDRPLTDEEKKRIRDARDVFEKFSILGPAIKGIERLGKLGKKEKPEAPAPEKVTKSPWASKPKASKPEAPKPGDPEFIGPVQPPKPGDPRFVGPYQYGGQGSSGVPSVLPKPPSKLQLRPDMVPRAGLGLVGGDKTQGLVDTETSSRASNDSNASRGVVSIIPPRESKKKDPKASSSDDKDPTTEIEDNKAERARQREDNFNMALIRAGLGIMSGKSSNALSNIGEGSIAGLEQFARAEKEDRAFAAEEQKYKEDRLARIQRAAELLQEKQLTRETRIFDIKTDENSRIDRDIYELGRDMKEALDETQKSRIQEQIDYLQAKKNRNERIIQETMSRLGYEGIDLYGAAPGSAFGIGSIVTQNGIQYRVTGVDQNGRPTTAEPVE